MLATSWVAVSFSVLTSQRRICVDMKTHRSGLLKHVPLIDIGKLDQLCVSFDLERTTVPRHRTQDLKTLPIVCRTLYIP